MNITFCPGSIGAATQMRMAKENGVDPDAYRADDLERLIISAAEHRPKKVIAVRMGGAHGLSAARTAELDRPVSTPTRRVSRCGAGCGHRLCDDAADTE